MSQDEKTAEQRLKLVEFLADRDRMHGYLMLAYTVKLLGGEVRIPMSIATDPFPFMETRVDAATRAFVITIAGYADE